MSANDAATASTQSLHTWEVLAEGRVQGVGYRYTVHKWASELGVRGWVRNEPDSNVRAILQHSDSQILNELCSRLRQGPSRAFVLNLEITPIESSTAEIYTSFSIRR